MLTALAPALIAQMPKLTIAPVMQVTVKHGGAAEVRVSASLNPGFHANSHTPNDETLIPLTLKWDNGPLVAEGIVYPKPQMEKYDFSDKPISVVTGTFEISTHFKAAATASAGSTTMTGKLRYQACSDRACYPPKTVDVSVPVTIQ